MVAGTRIRIIRDASKIGGDLTGTLATAWAVRDDMVQIQPDGWAETFFHPLADVELMQPAEAGEVTNG